jgi:hypothetical protein
MNTSYQNQGQIEALVRHFMDRSLPANEWTHAAHLTVGLYLAKKYSKAEAACLLRGGIITYNLACGVENTAQKGYHETLTLFWLEAILYFLQKNKSLNVVEACNTFLQSPLSSRELPLRFYSPERLFTVQARGFWTEPDKMNLDFGSI